MKIELFLDKKGKPRLRLKAGNGRILMSSEAYKSKRNAKDTARSIYYFFEYQTLHLIFRDIFKDMTGGKKNER